MKGLRLCGAGACVLLTVLVCQTIALRAWDGSGKAEAGRSETGAAKANSAAGPSKVGYTPKPLPQGGSKLSYGELNAEYFRRLEEAALEGYLINPGKGGGSQGSDALLRDYVIAACRAAGRRFTSDVNIRKHGLRLLEAAKQNGSSPALIILGTYLITYNHDDDNYDELLDSLPSQEEVDQLPALLRNLYHLLRSYSDDENSPAHISTYCKEMLAMQQEEDDSVILHRLCRQFRSHPDYTIFDECAESLLTQERWRWLGLYMQGLMYEKHAWNARGTGLAKDIPAEDWAEMKRFAALSDKALEESYRLRPDLPYAAAALISSLETSNSAKRMWFDRTVNAIPDFLPAYTQFHWMGLEKRWGGSDQKRIAFARECFAADAATGIPLMGLYPLLRVYFDRVSTNHLSTPDWRKLLRDKGCGEELQDAMQRMLELNKDEHELRLIAAISGMFALWLGDIELARKHLTPLANLDNDEMSELEQDAGRMLLGSIPRTDILRKTLEELHALSGKYAKRILAGEQELFAGKTAEGLQIWKEIISEAATNDTLTRDYLRERAALYMLKGKWGSDEKAPYLSALLYAAEGNNTDTVAWLLANGANPSLASHWYNISPLIMALEKKNFESAKLLITAGANVNHVTGNGLTVLYSACIAANPQLVRTLLEHGANPNTPVKSGWYPLMRAIYDKSLTLAEILIEHGASLETCHSADFLPLTYACMVDSREIALLLIKKGLDINHKDSDGFTPLYMTCKYNYPELTQILLENGALPDAPGEKGHPPLVWAAIQDSRAVIEPLLNAGANISASNKNGYTALHAAAYNNHPEFASILLDRGADINLTDSEGDTPLLEACRRGNLAVTKLLLERGAKPDIHVRKNGWSELMVAATRGHAPVVQLLLEHGADPERGVGKNTPLSVVNKGDEKTILILREAIARRKAAADAAANKPVDKNLAEEEAE